MLLVLFIDPVTAADGFAYERTAAEGLTNGAGKFVSPMTREELPPAFVAAEALCGKAKAFRLERGAQLLAFAAEGGEFALVETAGGVASPAPGVEQRVGGSSLLRVVRAASRLVIRRSRH